MEFSSMGTRPLLGASASPDLEEHSPGPWGMSQGQRLESSPLLLLHHFHGERCHLGLCDKQVHPGTWH